MGLKEYRKYGLIGRNIEIVEAKNKSLVGLKGKVVDETKNTLIIETKDREKSVLKEQVKLLINFKKEKIKADGKIFVGRPEERIKK
ncbi:MAG: ribonuclease P protein subunit [Candidatus Nanoarchaeia archaeon]|nr:ribonuclease P protein subunit [Candidatus Nanoarchaeia archaeon]